MQAEKSVRGVQREGTETAMKDEWWLYMVRCRKGALYCGIAKDVDARVARHNAGAGSKAVKALGRPVTLAFTTYAGSQREAMAMERLVKSLSKSAKEHMVQGWHK